MENQKCRLARVGTSEVKRRELIRSLDCELFYGDSLHLDPVEHIGDFDRNIIQRVQVIESHAVEQLQLADLLIGAVGYVNRGLSASLAKNRLIERIKQRSRYDLNRSTLRQESKFNLFQWQSRQGKSDYE